MSSHPIPSADNAPIEELPQSVLTLRHAKGMKKLTCLTCYDYSTAVTLDQAGVDILLVGDSLAMTVLGHPNTLSVTVDEMLHHTKAVARGAQKAFLVADMPFMSYQIDLAESVRNAGRFLKEGLAKAVKIEGASDSVLLLMKRLQEIGIPVMGHLGFTPQSVHQTGGFKVQAKSIEDAERLIRDAQAVQDAGAFALVIEMIPHELATFISESLDIPVIGIGAGNGCDGQILVVDDLLGRYSQLSPRFVRRYMQSDLLIDEAVKSYRQDIETGSFPSNHAEAFSFPARLHNELNALFERLRSEGFSSAKKLLPA
jgi:3-methyl-2-oxobutanoate hydroxymethyltransferase